MKLRNRVDEKGRILRELTRRYRMKDENAMQESVKSACVARYDALTKTCRF